MFDIKDIFSHKKAFVGYIMAGDGGFEYSKQAALSLIEGGVDILEIGVPFSDPVADGPSIQLAAQRALSHHIAINDVFRLIAEIKTMTNTPIVLFSYYNPIYIAHQKGEFFDQAKKSGVDAVLVVDLPYEEGKIFFDECESHGIKSVFLISPSTSESRIREIAERGSCMLYYVCRKGTTGVKNDLPEDLEEKVATIKSISNLPVIVGFGIGQRSSARAVANCADGFVVGSRFVTAMGDRSSANALTALAAEIDPR